MTTSACPKCHDEVTLPPGAPRGAQVRCPWCREEFALSDLLDRMPPMLEIVGGSTTAADDRRELPAASAADDDFLLAGDENGRTAPRSFDFAGTGAGAATAAAPVVAPRPRTAKSGAPARPRRKEKSAVAEIVKVIIGGVVGLVLAQLILWWLPGDSKKDPFELGPKVSEYVPWIVPAQFRSRTSTAGGEGDGSLLTPGDSANGDQVAANNSRPKRNTASGGRTPPSRPPGQTPNFPPLTAAKPQIEDEAPILGGPSDSDPIPTDPLEVPEPGLTLDPGSDLSLDPLTPSQTTPGEPGGNAPEAETPADPFNAPDTPESASPPSPPEPGTSPEPAATVETPSPAPEKSTAPDPDAFVGVNDAPMYVKNEVDAALTEAQAAQEAIQSADPEAVADAEQQFYTALTGLAEKLTYSDVNDPKIDEAAQQAKDLLVQGNVRERAKLLMAHGPARLSANKEDRPDNGIVLFGRVQAVEQNGALYETRLEMPSASGPAVTPVFSKTDPQLESGALVVVLGTIVDQPARRLSGYDGGLPSVVWMSHAAPLK